MTLATPATNNNNADNGNGETLRKFVAGSRERVQPFHDHTTSLDGTAQQVGPVDVVAYGFLAHLLIEIEASGGDQGGTPAVAAEDAPFSIIDDVQLHDVAGNPIVRLTGWELYLANKYGAYSGMPDPRQSPTFEDVDDDGNFRFLVRIPVQISGRDAFGALINQNASQTYKVVYTRAAAADVYDTQPGDTLPDIRVRIWLEARTPASSGHEQRPPQHRSLGRWKRYPVNVESGSQTIRLPHVGNHLRTLVAIFRDGSGDRQTDHLPDPLQLHMDGNLLFNVSRGVARHYTAERYGYDAAEEEPGGLDTGVLVLDWMHDLDGRAGFETRQGYLPTSQATNLELTGTFGASGVLTVLTNDVAIAGSD